MNSLKKIIKIKSGSTVPLNAKFLYAKAEKVKGESFTKYGIFWDTRYTEIKEVVYFYYEVDNETRN